MIEKLIKNDLSKKRWRRFKARKSAVASLIVLLLLIFFSFTAEMWANNRPILMKFSGEWYVPVFKEYHPSVFGAEGNQTDYRELKLADSDWALWPPLKWDPLESNRTLERYPAPPSNENLLGTDDRGRDVFVRLIYGFRYSMFFALLVWILESFMGITLGAIMGYAGGWVDLFGQRVIEVLESLPWLLLLITLVSIFSADMWLLVTLTAIFGWVGISLYIRAEFLKLRKLEFVEAAKAQGSSRARVIFKHILPNSLTPWITLSPFLISGNISSLAALDFLGFGIKAPTPSWGELLNQAKDNFQNAWWLAVYPSLALFITLVLLNLIGEAVRDALDPRKTL